MSSIRSYGYHQQGGLIWGLRTISATRSKTFTLMFISSTRSAHRVPLPDDDLAVKPAKARHDLKIAACIRPLAG